MIRFTILSLLVLFLIAAATVPPNVGRYDFVAGTSVTFDGTSTLHDYACAAGTVEGTLQSDVDDAGVLRAIRATQVTIPVARIACENSSMDERLHSALKHKDHPNVTFELDDAVVGTRTESGLQAVTARGRLTVAGVTKPVELTLSATSLPGGSFEFEGSVPLKMTDFEVKPPTMFFGALRTSDDLTVRLKVIVAPSDRA